MGRRRRAPRRWVCGRGESAKFPCQPWRSHSKISTLQIGVVANVRRAPIHHEPAIVENIGALRDLQALHDVLFDQEKGDALRMNVLNQGENFLDQPWRKAE